VAKPFDLADMVSAVERVLAQGGSPSAVARS
jgi:hypothetical protein